MHILPQVGFYNEGNCYGVPLGSRFVSTGIKIPMTLRSFRSATQDSSLLIQMSCRTRNPQGMYGTDWSVKNILFYSLSFTCSTWQTVRLNINFKSALLTINGIYTITKKHEYQAEFSVPLQNCTLQFFSQKFM